MDNENNALGDYLLFGSFLGLASLVYDIFPWYLGILFIAWFMKKPLTKVFLSLGIAIAIYSGFLVMQIKIFGFSLVNQNSDFIAHSLINIVHYLINFPIRILYELTLRGFDLYFYTLAAAFLVLPLFLAGFGFAFIKERRTRLFIFTFWMVPFVTFLALLYGNQYWSDAPLVALPRLHYTNFLWVYIASGVCLNTLKEKLKVRKLEFLSYAIPAAIILLMFLLSNADTFGWHQLYSFID
jgi:hypothetical protein